MSRRSEPRQGSTLAEVARSAGVSIATASRVLNGENKGLRAGPAARAKKIRQAAEKLGYRPDWRGRALRGGPTNSIGIVYSETFPMMDMTSYGPMIRAFGEVLQPVELLAQPADVEHLREPSLVEPARLCRTHYRMAQVMWQQGQPGPAGDYARRALRLAEEGAPELFLVNRTSAKRPIPRKLFL